MKFYISSEIKEKYPEVEVVSLPVNDVKVKKDGEILKESELKSELEGSIKEDFYNNNIFKAYRKFYEDLGFDSKKNLPSVESLYRRYAKSKKLPNINNVVDCVNLIALKTFIPLGIFNVKAINGDIMLRFSEEGEVFGPIGGGREKLKSGLVVMADDEKILSRFFYRDSIYQKVDEETKNVVILGCKVKGVDLDDVKKAIVKAGESLEKSCSGKSGELFLSEVKDKVNHIEIKNDITTFERLRKYSLKQIQPEGKNFKTLVDRLKEMKLQEIEFTKHKPIKTVEEGIRELGISYGEGVSTLIYKVGDKFVGVYRRDDRQLDNKKMRSVLGSSSKLATKSELKKNFGFDIGAVGIYHPKLNYIMDKSLEEKEYLYGGVGHPEYDVRIRPDELEKMSGAKVADISRQGSRGKKKKRILTGDTPSRDGKLHLGHYVGSLENRVKLQEEYDTFIIQANIHAYANYYEKADMINEATYQTFLDNLAVGIDPEKATIFLESGIPELYELYGFFLTMVKYERAMRNPTIKDEIRYKKLNPSIAFICYPILQAADILGFNADLVPVGEDQLPVVEQVREIARDFDKTYGKVFNLPEPKIGRVARLVGTDGNEKMSKSIGNVIFLSESEESLKKKVMSVYTDPDRIHATDLGKVKGNPVFVYHDTFNPNKEEVEDLKERYKKGKVGDVEVKEKLFKVLNNFLSPIREKRKYYEDRPKEAKEILVESTKRARKVVREVTERFKEKVGINKLIE
jgi:tryptophanyl-tRNA synthetase